MAKLPRVTVVQFGASGPSTDFGQFGSKTAAAPQTSQSPSVIMQLAAWATGWTAAAVGAAFNPYLEDMNGFCLVVMYFLANIFERGIPDWGATTTYYKGAVVQDPSGNGQQWYSLTDNNLGNVPPASASNAQWQWMNPPLVQDAGVTAGNIPVVASTRVGTTPATVADSKLADSGANIVIKNGSGYGLVFQDGSLQSVAAVSSAITQRKTANPWLGTPTATRAWGVNYQNLTGKPIFVSVVTDGGGSRGQAAYTDALAVPSTLVASQFQNGVTGPVTVHFIVLPNEYYRVDYIGGGSPNIAAWVEWN